MRYTLKNLGPGNWFCVEAGRLLQAGDTVDVNRIDYGTKLLAEGEKPRLQIIEHAGARLTPTPKPPPPTGPAHPAASAPKPTPSGGTKEAPPAKPTPTPAEKRAEPSAPSPEAAAPQQKG